MGVCGGGEGETGGGGLGPEAGAGAVGRVFGRPGFGPAEGESLVPALPLIPLVQEAPAPAGGAGGRRGGVQGRWRDARVPSELQGGGRLCAGGVGGGPPGSSPASAGRVAPEGVAAGAGAGARPGHEVQGLRSLRGAAPPRGGGEHQIRVGQAGHLGHVVL